MKKYMHFDRAEFVARLAAVKGEMEKRGIEVLLISEPPNQNYLTGYDAYSFYTPQMAIVALSYPEPVFITRAMDRISAVMSTYLSDDNIRGFPDQYVHSTTLSAYDYVAEVVKDLGGENSTIGVEMGGYYYSARAHADLVKALPNASFVDADLLINWVRLVKSPAELGLMRQAGKIADAMIQRAVETAAPGVRECDLAGAVYHQQMSGTPEFGGTYGCSTLMLCIGDRALAPHAPWTDDPLPTSTTINIEVHGNRHRYQVNLSRTIVIGKPSAEYQKFADIGSECLNAGLDAVRPGQTCSGVELAYSKALAKHGMEKDARIGYSIGLGYPPAVGERTASLRKEDLTVLQPGMCFHMMAAIWLEDKSIATTQSFAVSAGGYEALTSTPRVLFVK
ncbi:M24 family metallopeptidase [Bradyrhizobium brasilense]|uniref:M24 family metallopeptidase n=1 Tax=Bradyrhizobium brasilense TaxID=1419277 RepID=UPI00145637BB|nr:Xaa-Pro peptidase family protein [Bradyrhizobium brasilense]NLS74223.1 M24 family metallopeptidase [Bradyrhizobium brasilense]